MLFWSNLTGAYRRAPSIRLYNQPALTSIRPSKVMTATSQVMSAWPPPVRGIPTATAVSVAVGSTRGGVVGSGGAVSVGAVVATGAVGLPSAVGLPPGVSVPAGAGAVAAGELVAVGGAVVAVGGAVVAVGGTVGCAWVRTQK